MIQWTQELLRVIQSRQANLLVQSFTKLVFLNEQPKRQTYYCSIKGFGSQIVCIVLRDFQGNIILYEKCRQRNKIQVVQRLMESHTKHNPFFIYDQTDIQNQAFQLFLNENHKYKFAYLLKKEIEQDLLINLSHHLVYERENGFSIYYTKNGFKNISLVHQNMSKLFQFQSKELNQFQYFLGLTYIAYYPDRYFFLLKLINELIKLVPESISTQTIASNLQEAVRFLKDYFNKSSINKNYHYPKRGETKNLCMYCKKKKTQVVCEGCLKIQNKPKYLCIGNCYRKYHHYFQNLSSISRVQISKNIEYFDKKCSQLQQTMNEILKIQANPELLFAFLQHTNAKVAQYLNMAVERDLNTQKDDQDD